MSGGCESHFLWLRITNRNVLACVKRDAWCIDDGHKNVGDTVSERLF